MTEKYDESFYSGKVILVTGGAGAIGSNLCRKLSMIGAARVIIFDNMSSAYEWNIPNNKNITFIKGDIRNENDLLRAFSYRPEIIFHLAAFFANQNSVNYPLINEEVNGLGLIKVYEYAKLSGNVKRFVYTNSEGGAYGAASSLPFREDDVSIDLGSPYYISKMCGEAYGKFYFYHFGLPVTTVRLFNNYGPGEVPGQYRNVIPNFIYWALSGQPLPLTGNDEMARDFVYVDNTVDGILRAGFHESAIGGSYNIASGRAVPIHALAAIINQKTGNTAGVRIMNSRKWDQRPFFTGDTALSKQALGFHADYNFEKGIDNTIKWFRENWELITVSAEFSPGQNPALDVSL